MTLVTGALSRDANGVPAAFNFANISTATTTTVKTGSGILHAIVFNKHVASGVVTVYDNTAASGTVIATITSGVAVLNDPPVNAVYDLVFATGLTLLTSAAEDITVVYC